MTESQVSQVSAELRGQAFNALWDTFENEGHRFAPGTAERLADAVAAVFAPVLEAKDAEIARLNRLVENLGGEVSWRSEVIATMKLRADALSSRYTAVPPHGLGDVIDERDNATAWADRLAYAVAPVQVIGEHSNANNPWQNALEILEHCGYLSVLPDPLRASAPSEASKSSNHQPNQHDEGRPSASTPPASGSSDTGPRVWTEWPSRPPEDVRAVRDANGGVWRRQVNDLWATPCTDDHGWSTLLKCYGPLSEVVSSTEQEKPGAD